MTPRFEVIPNDAALALGLQASTHRDFSFCLVEHTAAGPRFVAEDGGEPEDQLLIRDWKWVPHEMNVLAAEAQELRERLKELVDLLDSPLVAGMVHRASMRGDDLHEAVERAKLALGAQP